MQLHHTFSNCFVNILFILLLSVLFLNGAQGEKPSPLMRIGLQTKQLQVNLQGTVPLQLLVESADPVTIPADQTVTLTNTADGLTISTTDGVILETTCNQVTVTPTPLTDNNGENTTITQPALIRIPGQSKQFDGKTDRLYRGSLEVIPTQFGLTVVNIVELEQYLQGVVCLEMSPGYPPEALRAQAIAARTYAIKNKGRNKAQGFDLDDTARCQVYGGYSSEDPRSNAAVASTAGMVLTYHDDLIDAVYSSTCGGITESAESAWNRAVPYLVSVTDISEDTEQSLPSTEEDWAAFFKSSPAMCCFQPKYAKAEAFRWVKLITRKELEAGLPDKYCVGTLQDIVPLNRGSSGRITSLKLVGSDRSVVIDSELTIRGTLGKLNSSAFTVDIYRDDNDIPVVFAFWGGGWGHGIGLCQVGAVGMALQGSSYQEILTHYYQGTKIEQYQPK